MPEATVEERGRILIPKQIRDELDLRGGQTVQIMRNGDSITIRKKKGVNEIKRLKGCITEQKVDPMDVKKIWG